MLEEYKDILGVIAGLITMSHMFSGMFICKNIYKNGSSKNIPSMPFMGGLSISILFLQNGLLMKDNTVRSVNFVGIGLNIFYNVFYYAYCPKENRKALYKQYSVAIAILAVLIGYAQWEHPDLAPTRFSTIVTTLLFSLIGAPLLKIKKIIRSKNSDVIPLPLVLTGTLIGISWLLYGIAAHQKALIYQHSTMLTLFVPQLVLCILYPSKNKIM